ncbi:MAG: hypothetical protein HY544_02630 [Candidatus Diapherotrites archaeon]|uniref:Uncharacterized protein n=1 Tax=Candidatus Iainarchaeum sp. TaxID=3101447 RepID=A0A8T3YL65_9ARCH|nr:hypothetical protein [Candidatus Diapherotrites archaeon]
MKLKTPLRKSIERGTATMLLVNEPKQNKILMEHALVQAIGGGNIRTAEKILGLIEVMKKRPLTWYERSKASVLLHSATLDTGNLEISQEKALERLKEMVNAGTKARTFNKIRQYAVRHHGPEGGKAMDERARAIWKSQIKQWKQA